MFLGSFNAKDTGLLRSGHFVTNIYNMKIFFCDMLLRKNCCKDTLVDPGGGEPWPPNFFWRPLSLFFLFFTLYFRINLSIRSIIGTFVTFPPPPPKILLFGGLVTFSPLRFCSRSARVGTWISLPSN